VSSKALVYSSNGWITVVSCRIDVTSTRKDETVYNIHRIGSGSPGGSSTGSAESTPYIRVVSVFTVFILTKGSDADDG